MTKCESCGHEERSVDDDIKAYFAAYEKCKASADPIDQYFARMVEKELEQICKPLTYQGKGKTIHWRFF